MPPLIEGKLVIAVASSALFDLSKFFGALWISAAFLMCSNRIFSSTIS
jgi:hypothetical protein